MKLLDAEREIAHILITNGFGPVIHLLTFDEMFAHFVEIINSSQQPNQDSYIKYPYAK